MDLRGGEKDLSSQFLFDLLENSFAEGDRVEVTIDPHDFEEWEFQETLQSVTSFIGLRGTFAKCHVEVLLLKDDAFLGLLPRMMADVMEFYHSDELLDSIGFRIISSPHGSPYYMDQRTINLVGSFFAWVNRILGLGEYLFEYQAKLNLARHRNLSSLE